jgi:hypothetical protein
MGWFGDFVGWMGAGAIPVVGPVLQAQKSGEMFDEYSGNKANREKQKKLMEQQKSLFDDEMKRREKAEADFKLNQETTRKSQSLAAANAAKLRTKRVDAPSTKGGTLLTGALGLIDPYQGSKRSILGA